MPTLTFYADEATAKKLKKVLLHKTKELGFKVSRGAFFSQYIQQAFDEITSNGHKPAPVEKSREEK
jgi:hypothetical protein